MKKLVPIFSILILVCVNLSAQEGNVLRYDGTNMRINKYGRTALNSNQTATPHLGLFDNVAENISNSFQNEKILLHLAAIPATYFLVHHDVDYHVHTYFHKKEHLGKWFFPVVITGAIGPIAVGGSLYFYGKYKADSEILGAGYALLQSSIITFSYMVTLKAITARPFPDPESHDMKELSKTFDLNLGTRGIFWAWPSGHTGATMAAVSTLTNYYPEKTWLRRGGYILVGYTLVGVAAVNRGEMHWFSDAVAASLMAYTIGSTVGNRYRESLTTNVQTKNKGRLQLRPILGANWIGFNFAFEF